MKTTAKAARLQNKEGKVPYSGLACLLMLLFAGFFRAAERRWPPRYC
jgi:hypothetical protein